MNARVTRTPVLRELRPATVDPDAWQQLDACPVCGSDEHLQRIGVVEAAEGPGTEISLCLDCEHGFRSRRPTVTWLDEFYATGWDRPGRERETIRVEPKTKILDFCRDRLPAEAGVLDVGAGFGAHLLPFRDAGHPVHANERSEHRAAYVRDELGIETSTAPFEEAEPPTGLGLVSSNHVLEHVDDPETVIAAASRALEPGGLLYTAVPNLPDEYLPQFIHYIPHLSAFSERSLTRLLARHGMRVVKAQADRELQLLAVKEDADVGLDSDGDPEQARVAARERAEDRVRRTFGAGPGRRTLAWWKSKESRGSSYRGAVIRGGSGVWAAILGAKAAQAKLPRRARPALQRTLPEYVWKASTRMLHVEVDGDSALPVRIRYEAEQPPVWVK